MIRFQRLGLITVIATSFNCAAPSGAQVTWTVLADHPTAVASTRSLRGLALSNDQATLYGSYIQGSTSAGIKRYTLAGAPPVGTVVPPFFNVTPHLPSGQDHQAEAVTTDDRGIVYAASIKDSTSGDNARIFVLDSTLSTFKMFVLANIDFADPTGETIGGVDLRKSAGVYQLYVARFRTLTPFSPYVERYIVGGVDVASSTLTLDPSFNGTGRFAIPGASHLRGIDVAADGTMFIASREQDKVWRIPATLSGVTSISLAEAMDVAVYNGNVYVTRYAGAGSDVVELYEATLAQTGRVFTATGSFPHTEAGTGYSGIDIDSTGRMYVNDQIYTGPSADRILVSTAIPPRLAPPTLTLAPDSTCYPSGGTVTVNVNLSGASQNIIAGDFYIDYDNTVLQFVDVTTGDPPFTVETYQCAPDSPMVGPCIPLPGRIDYSVEVPPLDPGTSANTTMAVIMFLAIDDVCNAADLIQFRDNTVSPPVPPTRLTNNLNIEINADLIDAPAITVDNTPPVITAPADAIVECDPSDGDALPGLLLGTAIGGVEIKYNTGEPETPAEQAYLKTQLSKLNANGAAFSFDTALLPPYNIPGLSWATLFGQVPPGQFGFDMVLPAPTWDLITPIPPLVAVENTNSLCGGVVPAGAVFWAINDYKPNVGGPSNPANCYVNSLFRSAGLAFDAVTVTKNIVTVSGTVYTAKIGGILETDLFIHWFNPLTPHTPMINFGLTGNFYFDGVLTYDSAGDPGNDGDFYAGTITISANSPFTGANAVGVATVTDNCTPLPLVTYSDVVTPGTCAQEKTIVRTWTAVDSCGNMSSDVQNITVQDTQPPVFTSCPANVVVDADVGGCDASVPVPNADAVDCCDPSISLTAIRSDNALLTLADPFPSGVTTITWTATDECGNSSQCIHTVTVNAVNTMIVDIELAGTFTTSFTRCIRFELRLCSGPAVIVDRDVAFTNGFANSVSLSIPCGDYDCITARDRKHTLRRTDSGFGPFGPVYVADFTGPDALISGNLNDDSYIDILDFGILAGVYLTNYGTGDTLCGSLGSNADLNGNGEVFTGDFTFIQQNFLKTHETNCCVAPMVVDLETARPETRTAVPGGPITSIAVKQLHLQGLGELAVADLNQDGWLDQNDIAAFMQGVTP